MNAPETVAHFVSSTTDLFVTVPETTLPNGIVVPSFLVGQFACSQRPDFHTCNLSTHNPVINVTGTPWTNIKYNDALNACTASGYALITETQWLAIAHNVAAQACNWTGGKIGEGSLFQGLRKRSVSKPQPGTYEPADPDERRWMMLSNGERIFDFAGNTHTWIFDDVQGQFDGLIEVGFAAASPSIAGAPYPSMEAGMGWRPNLSDLRDKWRDWAIIRGGCWMSGNDAGVFHFGMRLPRDSYDEVGFRCTK